MEQLLIPAEEARVTIRVANSRFLAAAAPAFTVEKARSFVETMRSEFDDASHHVPAFIIGHGNSLITHCSDDGEPSGTAGPPLLAALESSGLGDIVVVVTRYFGGTKLGTGGLVRAYSRAGREVLSIIPRARKVATHTVRVRLPYSLFGQLERLVELYRGQIVETAFAADVTVTARVAQTALSDLQAGLRQISHGQVEARIIASSNSTILPLRER